LNLNFQRTRTQSGMKKSRLRLKAASTCWLLLATFLWNIPVLLAQKNWTGATNTNWNTASNWNPVGIPSTTDNVVISSSAIRQPVLSTTAVANAVEVQSGASLSITLGGSLSINRSVSPSGTLTALNNSGTITNGGQISIGNTGPSYNDYGMENWGTFSNLTGGIITIDRATEEGFLNGGSFTNRAQIIIGGKVSVGLFGLSNANSFINDVGGTIKIDRVSGIGLYNRYGGDFTNVAQIILGSTTTVGSGVINLSTFNNSDCGALLSVLGTINDQYDGVLTNSGTIIKTATLGSTLSSNITNNSGLVRNLGGGSFIITNNTGCVDHRSRRGRC
jgi:hypothetical protein